LVVSLGSNKLGHDRRYVRRSSAPFVVHPAFPLAPWHAKTDVAYQTLYCEVKGSLGFFFSLLEWLSCGRAHSICIANGPSFCCCCCCCCCWLQTLGGSGRPMAVYLSRLWPEEVGRPEG
jgi:hypothetical protein